MSAAFSGQQGLPFEQPILDLDREIERLSEAHDAALNAGDSAKAEALAKEREETTSKRDETIADIFGKLTPWETVQLSRHPSRPLTSDYVEELFTDVQELHGDRAFADDPAMMTALARLDGRRVMLIGHRKGKTTKERVRYNFGCAHPEGYRKALLKMKLAEKYGLPIVTMINTPGAYPGIGAEERGQAMAIAVNIQEMALLRVPIVAVVIGEGGSGGALGIGVGDRNFVLQHGYYSVISPEGCASILFRDAGKAPDAAQALKLTAQDLKKLDLIDDIIPEPPGGAHRDPATMYKTMREWLTCALDEITTAPIDDLLDARYAKLRRLGKYREAVTAEITSKT